MSEQKLLDNCPAIAFQYGDKLLVVRIITCKACSCDYVIGSHAFVVSD